MNWNKQLVICLKSLPKLVYSSRQQPVTTFSYTQILILCRSGTNSVKSYVFVMNNRRLIQRSDERIFFVIVSVLELIIGSTGNLLIIITFIARRELRRKPSDLLILNLAVADFTSLTTYLPWHAHLLLKVDYDKDELKFSSSLNSMNLFNSSIGVISIAVDRFVAVVYPLRYKSLMTRKQTWIMIAVSWIAGFVLVGVTHTLSLYFDFHDDYYRKIFCAVIFTQLTFISVLCVKIFHEAKKQANHMSANQQGVYLSLSPGVVVRAKTTWKTVRLTLLIVFLFYGTLLPYEIFRITTFFKESPHSHSFLSNFMKFSTFNFMNSCINPFIYWYGNGRLRAIWRSFYRI